MAGFGGSVQPKWVRPGSRKVELTIISELNRLVTHWDTRLGRSVSCGGHVCELCHVGMQKQLRVFCMLIDGHGNDWLFELRERHRETFGEYDSVVGLVVEIWRAGTAKNSPVEVRIRDTRNVVERDITALCKTFALPAVVRSGTAAVARQLSEPTERDYVPAGLEDTEWE